MKTNNSINNPTNNSTISLSKITIQKISKLGKKGDTYDQIINKILEKQK